MHPHTTNPNGVLLTGSSIECMGGTTTELARMSPVVSRTSVNNRHENKRKNGVGKERKGDGDDDRHME